MHAVKLLHNITKKSCVSIHSNRLNSTFVAVNALVTGTKLSLAGIGRSIKTGTKVKNNIKRIDRLLGNDQLHSERILFYQAAANLIIGNSKQIPVIVDWSSLPDRNLHLLRAAIPSQGRPFTLYEEVHPTKKLTNRTVHKNFLKTLKSIIPEGCKIIIITDAGFHGTFFKEVETLGWDWIGRMRAHTKYNELGTEDWIDFRKLHKRATKTPKFICKAMSSRARPIECSIFIFKGRKKNRIDKNPDGSRKQSSTSRDCARGNKEPWVLITSLDGGIKIAKKVINLYKRRMQIEEGFRDMKNSRLGFGFEHSKTYILKRVEVLLLIAMLAILVVCLIGKAGEQEKIQYDFQANTVRNRTVLSLFFLGCQIVNQGNINFKKSELVTAILLLRQAVTSGLEVSI